MYQVYRAVSSAFGAGARLCYRGGLFVNSILKRDMDAQDALVWRGRFGEYPEDVVSKGPYHLWLHGVSVGEQAVLEPIIDVLLERSPDLRIVVSAFTVTGLQRAARISGGRFAVVPYPVDFPSSVASAISALSPQVYGCVETELWPNFLHEISQQGIKSVLLNGRISERSLPRYRRIRRMMAGMLLGFHRVCVVSEKNRDRFLSLGARPDSVMVTGNAKYQGLLNRVNGQGSKIRKDMARLLQVSSGDLLWVCGSLRKKEYQYMIEAFRLLWRDFSGLRLVLAPRHLKRNQKIEALLKRSGLEFAGWSALKAGGREGVGMEQGKGLPPVVLVDEIGELFSIYSIASVAFVGGTLEPLGGQNLMEPAAWGCPVVYGPSTYNFEDAVDALEEQRAGLMVNAPEKLAKAVGFLLENQEFRKEAGHRARTALERLAGKAAERQAELLLALIQEK